MDSAYVLGPIHVYGEDYLPVYKRLMEVCKRNFDEVIGVYPDFWDVDRDPQDFYKWTVQTITDYDIFIAEVTGPSHGVGMELQMAKENDIPVLALAREGEEISSMVKGLPNLHGVVRYSDVDDLVEKLEEELKGY